MADIPAAAVEIPSEPVDLSLIHPSLRHYYGDGMPLKTYRAENGATVRIWGACLPKTQEENHINIQRAWQVADQILERAAARYALEEEQDNSNQNEKTEAADGSHPISDPM